MEASAVLRRVRELPFHKIGLIDRDAIGYHKHVRDMCEMNACGQYGKNWMCPPGVGEMEELRNRHRQYPHALLYCVVQQLEDSFDLEGMDTGRETLRELSVRLGELLSRELGGGNFLQMGPGGCSICSECTYPLGRPCRFPERAVPPMEGCGIDVVELCAKTGFRYHHGPNTVTFFGLALFRTEDYGR